MRWLMVAVCLGLFVLPAYAADPIAENVAFLATNRSIEVASDLPRGRRDPPQNARHHPR